MEHKKIKIKSIKESILEKEKRESPQKNILLPNSLKQVVNIHHRQNQNDLNLKKIRLKYPYQDERIFSKPENIEALPFMRKNVIILLSNILQNRNIPSNNSIFDSLNNVERLFVFLFLLRKKKKHKNWTHLNINTIRKSELEYFIKNFKDFTSVKRFEEEFKFLFKYAIQFLKKELETNKIIPYNKKDIFLYEYYFNDISKEKNIPLTHFMDPSIIRKDKQKQIKTFGIQYLKILLSSEKFKKDFINFILKNIENIYLKKIKGKLTTIISWLSERLLNYNPLNFNKKFDSIQNQANVNPEDIKKFNILTNYLVFNNQCKLPWSLAEIKTARIRVIKKIEKLSFN